MNSQFNDWLRAQLDERGWTPTELARRSGISQGALSNILNNIRKPGPDVCNAIARPLGVPVSEVLRQAGILPRISAEKEELQRFIELINSLPPEERQAIYEYAQWRLERLRDRN